MTDEQRCSFFFEHMLSGSLAGLISDICVHPVDTVRARLQVQRNYSLPSCPSSIILPGEYYRNTAHAFISIIRTEGVLALYKGFGIVFTCTIPAHGLYFAGYEMAKKAMRPSRRGDEKGALVHFMAGIWAEICGSFIWVPQDVIKQRLQVQRTVSQKRLQSACSFSTIVKSESSEMRPTSGGSLQMLKKILSEEGFRGLFKGYWVSLATYAPFVAIYFTVYEQLKLCARDFQKLASLEDLTLSSQIVGGALAGGIAAAITCPMDVIKTRLQVESSSASSVSNQRYRNALDVIRRILKEEGIAAFGKGMTARILWIAPSTAITMASYEQLKLLFGLSN